MGLFNKHSQVISYGCEIYKKNTVLIDLDTYKIIEKQMSDFVHYNKEDNDYILATYCATNGNILYLSRYVNKKDLADIEALVNKNFVKKRRR